MFGKIVLFFKHAMIVITNKDDVFNASRRQMLQIIRMGNTQ